MTTAEEIETAILRPVTPEQKLAVVQTLWRQAWNLKGCGSPDSAS